MDFQAAKAAECTLSTTFTTLLISKCQTEADTQVRFRSIANLSMALAHRLGLMEPSILVNGVTAKLMVRALFSMQTATFSMAISKLIRQTAMESTSIKLGNVTRVNGQTTSNRALALKHLQMEVSIRGTFTVERSMDEASTSGSMAPTTMVSGATIKSKDMEFMCGPMDVDMKALGERTSFIIGVFIRGLMVAAMTASISTTRNMVGVFMCGRTARSTKATGIMENNTDKDDLQTPLARVVSDYG